MIQNIWTRPALCVDRAIARKVALNCGDPKSKPSLHSFPAKNRKTSRRHQTIIWRHKHNQFFVPILRISSLRLNHFHTQRNVDFRPPYNPGAIFLIMVEWCKRTIWSLFRKYAATSATLIVCFKYWIASQSWWLREIGYKYWNTIATSTCRYGGTFQSDRKTCHRSPQLL